MMNMDDKSTHLRSPLKALYHQRGFSDVTFQHQRDFSDPPAAAGIKLGGGEINTNTNINGLMSSSSIINDINDLDYDAFFSKYIDVDNTNEQEEKFVINNLGGDQKENVNINQGDRINTPYDDEDKKLQLDSDMRQCESPNGPPSPKHHGPNLSVTGSNINIQTVEAKKSMSAAKLDELWIVDPKRAKRIMANRQSAARSKERKARYISELERKVKSLQTEATALTTQLNIYKDDAVHLAAENNELKLQLPTMEHQAQLQDEITEAMTGEVESLRFTTGEIASSSSVKLGMQPQFPCHLLPLQCSTPAAADRQYTSQGLPPRLLYQPIVSHY